MYGIFTLSKAQVKKLYRLHPEIKRPGGYQAADDLKVDVVIPDSPEEKVAVVNVFGTHLGYISFEEAWRL